MLRIDNISFIDLNKEKITLFDILENDIIIHKGVNPKKYYIDKCVDSEYLEQKLFDFGLIDDGRYLFIDPDQKGKFLKFIVRTGLSPLDFCTRKEDD